jgi:hypothetical protein
MITYLRRHRNVEEEELQFQTIGKVGVKKGVGWQQHAPAALPPKRDPVPTLKEDGPLT